MPYVRVPSFLSGEFESWLDHSHESEEALLPARLRLVGKPGDTFYVTKNLSDQRRVIDLFLAHLRRLLRRSVTLAETNAPPFALGARVVCVDDRGCGPLGVREGETYTVAESVLMGDEWCVTLVGMPRAPWGAVRFRAVEDG